jgi:hypothetical protein
MLLTAITYGLTASIALLPTLSSAAALGVQNKRDTTGCTASVPGPSTVTSTNYYEFDTDYATAAVTIYSQGTINAPTPTPTHSWHYPSAVPIPSASFLSSPAAPPADCASTTTYTPTVTRVVVHTYSHVARATATAPACAAHNIYNGTVSYNTQQALFGIGQPRGESFPQLTTPEACCNQCFQGSCMWYTFDNIDVDGSWAYGCKIFWSDGGCPNGWGETEALRYEVGEGDGRGYAGLGGCLVEVPYFIID